MGYDIERDVKLRPTKYFNQQLLNYIQRFASDPDYIFYSSSLIKQQKLNSKINVASRNSCSGRMAAGMLSNNFSETVQIRVAKDKTYRFMNSIKGTPAYWKKFLHELLAMVKQLGLSTFFVTLSCADLRWNELISIISTLKGETLEEEEINRLDCLQRCSYLNLNPVLLARHFQHGVEKLFKTIVLDGILGKVKYHAIRVEFQTRGSPYIHSFLWRLDAPVLLKNNVDEYVRFVDSIVKAFFPNEVTDPELFS